MLYLFNRIKRYPLAGAFIFAIILCACSEPKFRVDGEIYGAADKSVVLEKPDFAGKWIVMDSVRIGKNGNFSISNYAPDAPEIYRLSLDGRYIYFPVDSIETIIVTSSLDKFGSEFSLTGSDNAERMAEFEKYILSLPANIPADSMPAIKKKIYSNYIMPDQASVVSYYILTKTIGGKPLFDPTNHDDVRYFMAVATGYKTLRPNDPRTRLLEETSLNAMKERNRMVGKVNEVEAKEITFIEIELPDENGRNVKLSDLLGKGKPTIVVFSLLSHPDTPALNVELANMYKAGNLNIYNVSLDVDQYEWRDAARNLPWVTVYDPEGQYSKTAVAYNVDRFPLFYIYDGHGELKDRANSLDELKKKRHEY